MSKTLKERIFKIAERASLDIQEDHGFLDTMRSREARAEIIEKAICQAIGEFGVTMGPRPPKSKFMVEWKGTKAHSTLISDVGERSFWLIDRLVELIDKYKSDKET